MIQRDLGNGIYAGYDEPVDPPVLQMNREWVFAVLVEDVWLARCQRCMKHITARGMTEKPAAVIAFELAHVCADLRE